MTDEQILEQRYQAKRAKRKQSITDPSYRVRISPVPVVIDGQGAAVADGFVVAIRFPRETIDTAAGHLPVVVGAGVAKILVGRTTIRGVPLC